MVMCKNCDNVEMNETILPEGGMHYGQASCPRCGKIQWIPNPNNEKKQRANNQAFKNRHRAKTGKLVCAFCGMDETAYHRYNNQNFELDHIIPLEDNGPDTFDNTQILCFVCHDFKTSHRRNKNLIIGKWREEAVEDNFTDESKAKWVEYYNSLVDKEKAACAWMDSQNVSPAKKEAEFLRYKCEVLEPLGSYLRFFNAIGIHVTPGEKAVFVPKVKS